jgi:hypothetical protein
MVSWSSNSTEMILVVTVLTKICIPCDRRRRPRRSRMNPL